MRLTLAVLEGLILVSMVVATIAGYTWLVSILVRLAWAVVLR